MRHHAFCVLLLGMLAFAGCCCRPGVETARKAAKLNASRYNMQQLILAISNYKSENDAWPNTLEDVREYAPGLDTLMTNPLTGESPGYEYVVPSKDATYSETIILYPLQDNVRDTTLTGYADGSVRTNRK